MKRTKYKKLIGTFLGVLTFVVNMCVPAFAQEVTFHSWATDTLLEGEKYGIYPLSWYDNMQGLVDAKTLNTFCEELYHKIGDISEVQPKDKAVSFTYTGTVTRQIALEKIYEVLQSYTYPSAVSLNEDVIQCMQETGVLQGVGQDLKLESTCTLEELAIFGTRTIDYIYKTLDTGSKGLLWKVEAHGNTVYLLGSIHLANYDIYPFNQDVLAVYEAADTVGFEVNLFDNQGLEDYNALCVYADGSTLKEHISEELYLDTVKASEQLGLTEEMIASCKPWYLANTFIASSSAEGTSLEEAQLASLLGIDQYFLSKAILDQKEVVELEGYSYQGNLFESFSPELTNWYLEDAVDSVLEEDVEENTELTINLWLDYWHKGDLTGFEESFPKESNVDGDTSEEEKLILEEYYNTLFTVRDLEMTEKIEAFLKGTEPKTYLVVLGAGHYIGDDGVVQNLKNAGYTVEQVK